MNSLTAADIEVLREVGRSESGLYVYTLHRRLSLGPAQLAALVRALEKSGLVALNSELSRVSLTEKGFQCMARIVSDAAMKQVETNQHWIYRPRLEVNFPYLPRRSIM